jgi:hypothetical protein
MSQKCYFRTLIVGAALLAMEPISALAWSTHVYLTYPVFEGQPEYGEKVPVEPLGSFLEKEKGKIGNLLRAEENWATANMPAYPPRPGALDFSSSREPDLRLRFLKALRLNPEMKIPLYVMLLPGNPPSSKKPLTWSALSVLKHDFQNRRYVSLSPGEKIGALEVLAAASDEPDYGLDIGLWADNDTPFGREYGYGKQPFGNPKLDYGTQAPFHMGFYHESGIIYAAAPSFKKTFPEQRVHLFRSLAKLAFETGHPYWGYRFAGWGLHYLQDLTMPYHTTIMPGRSTLTMLSIAVLDMVGIHGPKEAAVDEVSRAHILIEKLLCEAFEQAYQTHDENSILFKTLKDRSRDGAYPAYSDRFPSRVVAKESREAAGSLSSALRSIVKDEKSYLNIEKISSEGDYDARRIIAGSSELMVRNYNKLIEDRMRSLGAFSRIYMNSLIGSEKGK